MIDNVTKAAEKRWWRLLKSVRALRRVSADGENRIATYRRRCAARAQRALLASIGWHYCGGERE